MKFLAGVEGLAVLALMATVLDQDALVAISDDREVALATAGDTVVGRVRVPNKAADEKGTVETRFRWLIEIKASGNIAAGEPVKMSSASSGQRVAKFVAHTDLVAGDPPEDLFGVCWYGGNSGETIEVLVY